MAPSHLLDAIDIFVLTSPRRCFEMLNLIFLGDLVGSGVGCLVTTTMTLSCLLLFLWRLLRFSVLPIFRPEEPKEIPHWFPGQPMSSVVEGLLLRLISLSHWYPFLSTMLPPTFQPDTSDFFVGHMIHFLINSDNVFSSGRYVFINPLSETFESPQ